MNNNDNAPTATETTEEHTMSTTATTSTFGNAYYGPYRVLVPGDFSNADPSHVVWIDYLFENGRGGTAPIESIKFDSDDCP